MKRNLELLACFLVVAIGAFASGWAHGDLRGYRKGQIVGQVEGATEGYNSGLQVGFEFGKLVGALESQSHCNAMFDKLQANGILIDRSRAKVNWDYVQVLLCDGPGAGER